MEGWDYVYGVSPVLNALASGRREIEEFYVQDGMKLSEKKVKSRKRKRRREGSIFHPHTLYIHPTHPPTQVPTHP